MKYKTKRQFLIGISVASMLICIILGIFVIKDGGDTYPMYFALCVWLMGITFFTYCISYNLKRRKYKTHGKRIPAYIIGANAVSQRWPDVYCMIISFYDKGQKVWHTEGYVGDPNDKLKDCRCYIYKLNGHYIEADLHTLKRGEKPKELRIPIHRRYFLPFWEHGKVEDRL